jgi:hypothetical protein
VSNLTMSDLPDRTRIRHVEWGETGTIRRMGGTTEIRWDDSFGEIEVSDDGPVYPEDLELIGGAA